MMQYLKIPLWIARLWVEAKESPYPFKQRLDIFFILLSLRIKEISQTPNTLISKNIFGFKVYAYDYTTLLFLFREIFLTHDYDFNTSKEKPFIIDIGSNIGMSVLYHAMRHPNAEIIAFEPNPSAFELLKKNVEENHLHKVTLYNKALSDQTEPLKLFINNDKGSLLSSNREDRGGSRAIEIESDLLSAYINRETDLIKMDVEGAEWAILNNLKQHTDKLKQVNELVIEYHHKMGGESSRLAQFLTFFQEQGFEYNMRTQYRELGNFQDIILHFYRP